MVWGNGVSGLKLLKCVGNVWTLTGTANGAIGDSCPINGQLGETSAGVSVICSNNVWMQTTTRMGRWAVMASYYALNGSIIYKPACEGGGTPKLVDIPQAIDAAKLWTSFTHLDYGSYWSVSLTDGAGNATQSAALVQAGCWY